MIKKGVYIIAEAGVNHNGDINLAYELIDAAKTVGADAIKFQTFKTKNIVTADAEKADYQKINTGIRDNQYDMLKKLELSFKEFMLLKDYCDEKRIDFLSSPFDHESIDFLSGIVNIFKIPSGEITNYPYLKHIASKGKDIIMSTGMADLSETEKALDLILSVSDEIKITLLHCTSNYPAPFSEVNLNAMITLKNAFKLPVGYSDHTKGIEIPIAAVALGAEIIEKHFTVDNNLPGPDHVASLNPKQFADMVESIRNVEYSLGTGVKKPAESEKNTKIAARKSIVALRDIEEGEILSDGDIIMKRPGNGLNSSYIDILKGRRIIKKIHKDELLKWENFMR